MYRAVREFESDVAPGALLDVVWEVERYPDFVKGVRAVDVLSRDDHRCLARFTAGLAGMDFHYVLACERDPAEVRWARVSGAFHDAAGRMTHLGGHQFRYENALDPGFAVPEFAVRFVLERSLPRLIREFTDRARARARATGS